MSGHSELRERTKAFSLRIIHLCNSLPGGRVADAIGRQLIRSGTSVGSNYRAACRARSTAEFMSKLGVVEEEADESAFWLELLGESRTMKSARLAPLLDECNEITAMVVASITTARRKLKAVSGSPEPGVRRPSTHA